MDLPTSSVKRLKTFLLSSLVTEAQILPSNPALEFGISMSGTCSSLNVDAKSDSKNDSRISSARTTMRNLTMSQYL